MLVMFDSVTIDEIPGSAVAVAGYVDGNFQTIEPLRKRFGHAKVLTIAVHPDADADCLDIEPGDALPFQAHEWVKRQIDRGLHRPVVYCPVSSAPNVLQSLRDAGIERTSIRLWTAHYTGRPHICGPECWPGLDTTADGTQWTDKALGRNLDESLVQPDFFEFSAQHKPPKPAPAPAPKPAPAPAPKPKHKRHPVKRVKSWFIWLFSWWGA